MNADAGAARQVIRRLPPEIADTIAAGEVVQRPASAVKELIENALDAGAGTVGVILQDSGRTLLQVTDDGCGMGWDDALAAFGRHATSKIERLEDLGRITTLGFRGEALAAIAAVSMVELRTRTRDGETGALVRIEGGRVAARERIAAPPGTSIAVRNLFYNTPGRRKFLKSDRTEFRHILDAVQRAALSRPGTGMSLQSDGEQILRCGPESIERRIAAIVGDRQAGSLIRVEAAGPEGEILGFLGRPEFARRGRAEQYLFLNGRPIASRSIGHAVSSAYEHLLEKGSFPLFILFLTVDPGRTDVNVHPAKTEVRFDDEQTIYRWVHGAARRAIAAGRPQQGTTPRSAVPAERPAAADAMSGPAPGRQPAGRTAPGRAALAAVPESLINDLFRVGEPSPAGEAPSDPAGQERPCWQVHDRYIVAPTGEGLMIVDQHAAHERILYERVLRRIDTAERRTQELLFPQTLEMNAADAALVTELLPLLEGLGFLLRPFGPRAMILEGVPVDLRPGDETTVIRDVIGLYREDAAKVTLAPRERLAKTYACRAAVKSGDRLSAAEMQGLLADLFRAEIPDVCPHGRPVLLRFTLGELDRRFGRTT